eukprot:1717163-Rhodomonas_salina.1
MLTVKARGRTESMWVACGREVREACAAWRGAEKAFNESLRVTRKRLAAAHCKCQSESAVSARTGPGTRTRTCQW